MRVQPITVKSFRVYDAPKLDPVTVVIENFGGGAGRLLIECYGDAWTGYWGAMGEKSVEQFLLSCSTDYIVGKMLGNHHSRARGSINYVYRVVEAVQSAVRLSESEEAKQ